jgi:hypothetical protein
MTMMSRLPLSLALTGLAALPAFAQNETALKNAFMGRQVAIRVDMPASHKGVDLRFDREVPFDLKENGDRIREHDAALQAGDVIQVTYIKVKGDLIEFHLGGGGFNWFSDTTTRSTTSSSKTVAEQDLEKQIKVETDRNRKRNLERDLDYLRRDREDRDRRANREVEEYNVKARERDMERALKSGSRFNLRFKKNVPADALTAEGFERYLDPWVDFSGRGTRKSATASSSTASSSSSSSSSSISRASSSRDWRKGTPRRDMEAALGKARREKSCPGDDSGLDCRIATFEDGNEEIEATFVEGILVRFSTRRK